MYKVILTFTGKKKLLMYPEWYDRISNIPQNKSSVAENCFSSEASALSVYKTGIKLTWLSSFSQA